jgi:hypothetical protein
MRPIIPNTTRGYELPYCAGEPWHFQICQARTPKCGLRTGIPTHADLQMELERV